MTRGRLIVIEGIERCGKSTLSREVAARLRAAGIDVVHTNEPGATPLGAILRREALSTRHDAVTEALLFAADRAEHCETVILPALERGAVVLCDRFEASSIAYQGAWRGLGEDLIRSISRFASKGLEADLTVWLKLDPLTAASRRLHSDDALDEIASRTEVAQVLHESFSKQSSESVTPWWILDATKQATTLADEVTTGIISWVTGGPTPVTASASSVTPGRLLLVTGPSGSGKNTVVDRLRRGRTDIWYSVSATTRPPREGEIDGVDYNFVSNETFDHLVGSNGLLEWAEYAGHRYGTPSAPVLERLARGEHVVCIIELDGAEQVKAALPEARLVFIVPPTWDELVARLGSRGTENTDAVNKRLDIARHEMEIGPKLADHVVTNSEVHIAAAELAALLR